MTNTGALGLSTESAMRAFPSLSSGLWKALTFKSTAPGQNQDPEYEMSTILVKLQARWSEHMCSPHLRLAVTQCQNILQGEATQFADFKQDFCYNLKAKFPGNLAVSLGLQLIG
ncbi:hypothetical protein STEG23_022558, partial [Scotinomys teguina]